VTQSVQATLTTVINVLPNGDETTYINMQPTNGNLPIIATNNNTYKNEDNNMRNEKNYLNTSSPHFSARLTHSSSSVNSQPQMMIVSSSSNNNNNNNNNNNECYRSSYSSFPNVQVNTRPPELILSNTTAPPPHQQPQQNLIYKPVYAAAADMNQNFQQNPLRISNVPHITNQNYCRVIEGGNGRVDSGNGDLFALGGNIETASSSSLPHTYIIQSPALQLPNVTTVNNINDNTHTKIPGRLSHVSSPFVPSASFRSAKGFPKK
jgi:hypothetical protein